ncbi:MAG TPA: hypothetical protein PKY46_04600 [Ignavibacteriaceae bacterium]|nr:hypothetical protein [Ignavibacteriaceae bacterium]
MKKKRTMKTKRIKLIGTAIVIFCLQTIVPGQSETGILQKDSVTQSELNESLKTKIGLTARTYSDSVIVRWAVSKPAIWDIAKVSGFILERAPILPNGTYGQFKSVKEGPFKIWTEEEWEAYFLKRGERRDTSEVDYDALAYVFGTGGNVSEETPQTRTGNEIQDLKDKAGNYNWQVLFAMLSANSSRGAAEGLGLRYTDKDVKPGERYVYKIKLAGTSPIYIAEEGILEVKVEPFNPDFARQTLVASENEGSIGINWKANNELSFYKVFRSEDNGKTFESLTKIPLLTMRNIPGESEPMEGYQDSSIVNYKPYIYRVYGTTSFADEVLIGEIKAMGRDRTPPPAPFVPQPENISDNEVKVKWDTGDTPPKDLKGFYVGRDTSTSGEFNRITELLPPTAREYTDRDFIQGGDNFYLVEAIDTAGNVSRSYPVYIALNDTLPPAKPEWIKGSMDSNGVVTLIIKPNKEKDLMGYRILTSNSPEHEFSSFLESFGDDSTDYTKITEFKDTVSLETTTPYIYYRATALDNRYNESDFSEIIAVKRPDVIPPVTPVIIDVEVTDKSVTLSFARSTSEDVKYQVAYRRIQGEDDWDSLAVLGSGDSIFTDKSVKPNIMYEYALLAADSAGLRSPLSFPVSARPYYTGILPAIRNLKVLYDGNKNETTLSWDYDNPEGVYFVIYRSSGDVFPGRYATVNEQEPRNFTDRNLTSGKENYIYAIKVFDNSGGESIMSEAVKINVK